MRFSIIVPVYNVEKYIDKCMYTLTHQTFDDYEVIVVNDETPDNSMQIVEKYAEMFPGKIRMFHQKNTRQGGARNNGVGRAKGEYILFVDSDDYVALNMLETLDAHLNTNPCDILVFQHIKVTAEGEELYEYRDDSLKPGVYYPQQDKDMMLLACTPWGKAFRRQFYVDSKVLFPEKLLYEDAVTRILYAQASSIAVCEDRLYYYVQSGSSSMRRNISEKMLDILTVTDIVIREFQERGLYSQYKDVLECSLIYGVLYVLDYINDLQPDHPIQVPVADYITTRFPDYRRNPYIGRILCRGLDYLSAHEFRKYHLRILVFGRFKERLLRIPLVRALNALRKQN